MSERLARVALNLVSEPGNRRLAGLVAELGAEVVLEQLLRGSGPEDVRAETGERLGDLDARLVLQRAERAGIRFLIPGDPAWPARLADLDRVEHLNGHAGAPTGLWVRGHLGLAEAVERSVAVVGSRSATSYGGQVAADLAAGLVADGLSVVSGAAYGIDAAAHRGALGGRGATVAVLACGVDRVYPSAHRELLDVICERGAVVSELAPGRAPTRVRFLARNRLIAALTQGTVVVEAAVRSGALNTANWAARLNRLLMGVPGPVTSAPSEGVHELIRTRGASLVTRAADVLELLEPLGSRQEATLRAPERPRDRLGELDRRVLEAVPVVQGAPPESVARTAGVPPEVVRRTLARLGRDGMVEESSGRWRVAGEDAPAG